MAEDYILSHTAAEVDVAIGKALVPKPFVARTKDGAELVFADEEGLVIVRFADGHIKTLKFDSSMAARTFVVPEVGDLNVVDEEGNIIAQFANGHIKTKNFDSSAILNAIGNVESLLEALL